MGLFKKAPEVYSRTAVLSAASAYRAKGKRKKAIAEYRKILNVDADDHEVHGRLAPLLADEGDLNAAWDSWRASAEGFAGKGFAERAISVYKQALERLPKAAGGWQRVTELYVELERPRDALKACFEGRASLRAGREREAALRLMLRALELEPRNLEATLDAALLHAQRGDRDLGLRLLASLLPHTSGADRRRVRARVFRLAKTPGNLWRWLVNAAT